MSARHQAEKAALLEQKEKVWDPQVAGLKVIALIKRQQRQKRIQEHNAAQNQAIQKQNRLGEEYLLSVLRPRIVQGPRKTMIRQGWSIFVAKKDMKEAKKLVGGKVVESNL